MLKGRNLQKSYGAIRVLKGVSLDVAPGKVTALVGASGAGKTTLLQMLGALDKPDAGEVLHGEKNISQLSPKALARFRNQELGFVFQFHSLMAEFTAWENVCIPAFIRGTGVKEAKERALFLLGQLNLSDRATHKPSELSGGEKQRAAVARALMNEPSVVLADEPTGNLDVKNSEEMFGLFMRLAEETNIAFLIATHDLMLARQAHYCVEMEDGLLAGA